MRDAVRDSRLTQENIEVWRKNASPRLLKVHGYEVSEFDSWSVRVTWGEWGVEHLTVPGNACGMDISKGISAPQGGRVLLPHNVDCMRQCSLLIHLFLDLIEILVLNKEAEFYEEAVKK
jgi:hypothetical protein